MKILIIDPGKQSLNYYLRSEEDLITCGRIGNYRDNEENCGAMNEINSRLTYEDEKIYPEAIAIRVPFGGNIFKEPAILSGSVLNKMKILAPASPLHLPAIIMLAQDAGTMFPGVPVVFIFETAFFTGLPARERNYAIDPNAMHGMEIQRLGFHGILHEAACKQINALVRRQGGHSVPKIISICLEPRPEAAAAKGIMPIMTTGGATPLEGLFGDTSCGEIDPGILIKLAQELKWGPEQINKVLTEESGIEGLLGSGVKLADIFSSKRKDYKLVCELFLYKMLLACGAAVAAMGTLDYIVFSGRYKDAGKKIGPWLVKKMGFLRKATGETQLTYMIFGKQLDEVMFETAAAKVKEYNNEFALTPAKN